MPDSPRYADPYKIPLLVWGAGAAFLFIFVALIWAIVWTFGFGIYLLFRWEPIMGISLGVLMILTLFVPPLIQDRIFERQMQAVHQRETHADPLDMTGKAVLFLGSSPYMPFDCTDLCRTLAEFGAAEAVYFGHDRSLSFEFGHGPIDLTARDIRTYPSPVEPGLPDRSPVISAKPVHIDIVVVQYGIFLPDLREELLGDLPGYEFLFPFENLHLQYMIYEPDDPKAFDVRTDPLLFSRIETVRRRFMIPYIPGLALGELDFTHQHIPGASRFVDRNDRDAAAFLCGPVDREDYALCAHIRD